MTEFTKAERYPVATVEFDCMVCCRAITEQYYPNDCLCCDCVDKGYDVQWTDGQPIVISPSVSMTKWTVGDMAELTSMAVEILLLDDSVYCEYCGVVAIGENDKYCLACVNQLIEDMALAYDEQVLCNGGLY